MMAIAGCAGLHQAFYRESSDFWIGAVHRKMCSDPPGAKLSSDFAYGWIPVVGPIIGGIIGALLYAATFGSAPAPH
jgi:Major intrinsic protein